MIIFEQNRNSYFLNRLSDVNNFSKAVSFRYRKSDVHTRYKIKVKAVLFTKVKSLVESNTHSHLGRWVKI